MRECNKKPLIQMIRDKSIPLAPRSTGEELRRNKNSGKPKAVLFDIYGTLFISASGDISLAEDQQPKNERLKGLVDKYHLSVSAEELSSRFIAEVKKEHVRLKEKGVPYPEVQVTELWSRILSNDESASFQTASEFALDYELAVNPVYPMPGLSAVLDRLKDNGLTMGIVSNAQFFTPLLFEAFLDKTPEELGFSEDLCFFSYSYRRAKPDLFLYKKAAESLRKRGLGPEEALYIGNDMLNDVYPASQTGFQTALFAGDNRSLRWRKNDSRCSNLKPDWVINSLVHLLDII